MIQASRDPGRFAVDRGRQIANSECEDENMFYEQAVMAGYDRAERQRFEPMEFSEEDLDRLLAS